MLRLWQGWLHVQDDVFDVAGLLLAAMVSVHVLLRKREVASSVGWIGLAWFAPVTGAITYFVFGVNRVQRRARKLRPGETKRDGPAPGEATAAEPALQALRRAVGKITGDPLQDGNAVAVYHDGDEAYPPMLEAIAAARHSIGLASYIFRNDAWGSRFIEALAEAQARGVAVRVLIDGIGGGWLLSSAYRHLRRNEVPAIRFLHSPLPWRMPFLNLRNHKKILIVDGRIGFTGGMNIADENVMATRPADPVQDTHFRIEGPVVAQLADAFVQDWFFAADEELPGDAWFPAVAAAGATPARVVDSGPDENLEKIEFAILQAVACAKERIAIMTPYFLPDDRLTTALALAVMRGIAVEVTIPERSDHVYIDWATRPNIGPLLTEGVQIWLSPAPFRHSKMMVVDGEWCLIGSSNWDMRSFRLNFELCMELYDRDLAAALEASMHRCRTRPLTEADVRDLSLPIRLRNAATRLMLPYL